MSKEALRKKLLKIRRKNYKDSLIKIKNIKSVILKNKINNTLIGGYYPVNFEVDGFENPQEIQGFCRSFQCIL